MKGRLDIGIGDNSVFHNGPLDKLIKEASIKEKASKTGYKNVRHGKGRGKGRTWSRGSVCVWQTHSRTGPGSLEGKDSEKRAAQGTISC